MDNLIKIHLYEKAPVPPLWHRDKNLLLNRLYVIYGRSGFYSLNGKLTDFEAGHLYLFPCNLDIDFQVDANNPLIHLFFYNTRYCIKRTCKPESNELSGSRKLYIRLNSIYRKRNISL